MMNTRPITRGGGQMSPLLADATPLASPTAGSKTPRLRRPFQSPGIFNCAPSSVVYTLLVFWLLWIGLMFYIQSHPDFLDPLTNRHAIAEAQAALARELDGEGHTHRLPGMIIHHDKHHHNIPIKKVASAVAAATDSSKSTTTTQPTKAAAAEEKQAAKPTPSKPGEPVMVTSNPTPPRASSELQGATAFTPNAVRITPNGHDTCTESDFDQGHTSYEQYTLDPEGPRGGSDDYTSDDAPLRQLSVDVVNEKRSTYEWGPTTKQRGVIVYMCTSEPDDVGQLEQSLSAFGRSYIEKYDYPIAIFHEDYSQQLMQQIQRVAPNVFIYFVKIRFQLPKHLKPLEALGIKTIRHRIPNPQHPTGFHEHEHGLRPYVKRAQKYPYGYQHMCRFFSGAGFMLPFFDAFDWYWRLDSDTVCQGTPQHDLFDHLSSCGKEYSHLSPMFGDGGDVVEGLWNAAVNFTETEKIKPFWMHDHPLFTHWGENDLFSVVPSFNTNCEIASLSFLRSKGVQKFHRFLDEKGGYFLHRWGDAPVRFFEVSMMMEQKKTEGIHGIQCYHN